jgi:isocitrate dehydrogenase kinase/phosphatase
MRGAYVRDDEMFVLSPFDAPPQVLSVPVYKRWVRAQGESLRDLCERTLRDQRFDLPWEDLGRDVDRVVAALQQALHARVLEPEHAAELAFELIRTPFYRNKGAYLVGRVVCDELALPITLPVLNNLQSQGGAPAVYVDALVSGEDELSIVFSFTRAYFMVDTPFPSALVAFLQSLMPQKQRSELYAALGLHKHGKTEFYRNFVRHLASSDDPFVIAPGIKGMVMAVFTLPSYRTVFKIIKDHFAPQKTSTRAQVRASYRLVKEHDRVGRMADTQEFHNMVFPRARFAPDLVQELLATCAGSVQVVGDRIVIAHLYTERAMTPLNLYLQAATDDQIRQALDGYGRAIKELAAANIFAGDMLLKNFGVTRHGRVVFYDYDEICYLTEVNFRHIPPAHNDDEEMSAEPWYSVAPGDVFPEEFEKFLFGRPGIRTLFRELHGELFDADYWKGLQAKIRAGAVLDVFPYPEERRFERR